MTLEPTCAACRRLGEPADLFCRGCGAFLAPLTVTLAKGRGGVRIMASVAGDGPKRDGWEDLDLIVCDLARDPPAPIDDVPLLAVLDGDGGLVLPVLSRVSAPLSVGVFVCHRAGAPRPAARVAAAALNGPKTEIRASSAGRSTVWADALRTEGDESFIPVHLTSLGGISVVTGVRLAMVGGAGRAAPRPVRHELLPGERASVNAVVSPGDRRALAALRGEARARLVIEVEGASSPIELPLTVVRQAPAHIAVTPRPRSAALGGRRLRLGVRLENDGGAPLRVTEVAVRRHGDPDWRPLRTPLAWRDPLGPKQVRQGELRPWMTVDGAEDGEALAVGPHRFEVRITAEAGSRADAALTASAECQVVIRAEKPLRGRLCIDFGTTESAAAISSETIKIYQPIEQPPAVVELGALGAGVEDSQRFLRTGLAIDQHGQVFFGEEADEAAADPDVLRVENLKWLGETREAIELRTFAQIGERLRLGQPVRVETIDPMLLRTAFLKTVRDLIETHPDVAATIDAKTVVFATRPAIFTDKQTKELVDTFKAAGLPAPCMKPRLFGSKTLVSESWPPLLTALEEEARLSRLRGVAEGPWPASWRLPAPALSRAAHIIVYDVGGGSADISLLRLTGEATVRRVDDLATATSRTFTGLGFAALIEGVLAGWLLEQTGERYDPATKGAAAGLAMARAVRAFQFNDGLFSIFASTLRELLVGPVIDAGGVEAALRAVVEADPQVAARLELMLPLQLVGIDGEVAIPQPDALRLAGRIVSRFAEVHYQPLADITRDLREAAGVRAGHPGMRLIPSGRGGAFPLARTLIALLWSDFDAAGLHILSLNPIEAKSITSWGGAYLADQSLSGGRYRFSGNAARSQYRVSLPVWDSRRQSAPMDPVDDEGAVRAILQASELGELVLQEHAEIFRGPPQADPLDVIARLRLDRRAAPERQWLVVVQARGKPKAVVVEADTRADAIARVQAEAS